MRRETTRATHRRARVDATNVNPNVPMGARERPMRAPFTHARAPSPRRDATHRERIFFRIHPSRATPRSRGRDDESDDDDDDDVGAVARDRANGARAATAGATRRARARRGG